MELLQEQDALHRMSAYQAEAAQLLDFAALAEQLEGELTLYPAGTGYAPVVAALGGPAAAVSSGLQSVPAAPAASTAAAASSEPEAAAAVSSGSSGNALAAALAAFGCSGLDQGAAAAVAAAASDDSVDLDAALAELDDADLALLVQQVQDGSGRDWLDDLQNWLEEPVPTLPTQPAQQPMQVAQPTQAPLQAAQVPQSQQQPQQQPVSKRRQQVEAEEALLRELTREPPLPVRWDQYPLQPPSWLLRCAQRVCVTLESWFAMHAAAGRVDGGCMLQQCTARPCTAASLKPAPCTCNYAPTQGRLPRHAALPYQRAGAQRSAFPAETGEQHAAVGGVPRLAAPDRAPDCRAHG